MWKGLFGLNVILILNLTGVKCLEPTDELLGIITKSMDLKQNPCENFYGYACNNWQNTVPKGEMYLVDSIDYMQAEYSKIILEFFQKRSEANVTEKDEVYKKARKFYEVCVSTNFPAANDYMVTIQKEKEFEWLGIRDNPVMEWNDENWHWLTALGQSRRFGLDSFLLQENLEPKNATVELLKISKPDEAYYDHFDELYIDTVSGGRDFQHRLQNLTEFFSGYDDKSEIISLKELKQKIKGFDMDKYMSALLQKPVSEDTEIFISHLEYFKDLVKLIDETPKNVLAFFIAIKMKTNLLVTVESRKLHCVKMQRSRMKLAINYIYQQEFYNSQKDKIEPLIQFVFDAIKEELLKTILENVAQFNETQVKALRDKVNFMQLNIGDLPKEASQQYYSDYYKDLEVTDDFIVNRLNLIKHNVNKEHARLYIKSPYIEHRYMLWNIFLPTYRHNTVVVPFHYLIKPVFDVGFHQLFLCAGVGNLMAYEILHAFNLKGLRFDLEGNPTHLFDDALEKNEHIKKSVECLRRESTSEIDEKLVYFDGFRLAYDTAERLSLIGNYNGGLVLEPFLSDAQLFFVKYAQQFCAASSEEYSYELAFKSVKNHRMFAKAFECPEALDENQRCELW